MKSRRIPGAWWLRSLESPSADGPSANLVEGVEVPDSAESAAWIRERLLPWSSDGVPVGAVIPTGFEAYARIFHPPRRLVGRVWIEDSWAAVASRHHRVAHPTMQWEAIARPPGVSAQPTDLAKPPNGRLDPQLRAVIAELLSDCTSTPDSYTLCVWEGWGGVGEAFPEVPRVVHPFRTYLCLRGTQSVAVGGAFGGDLKDDFGPAIWWPTDKAWVVATEVDYRWSYVAGPERGVRQLLEDRRLEAMPADPLDRADFGSDTINGPVAPY